MAQELALLLEEGVIDEVIGGLKTGKEAEVYLVRHQGEIVAAKIYKERHARSFQHNADYKEGRLVRNTRTQRAMDRGSKFGQAAAEDAWKSAESDALYRLHAAGVRVPTPVLFYEGVLLMQLVVDAEGRPAPRLIDAHLGREAAAGLYRDLRRQAMTMLCEDLIHGDLSPYNVLLGAAGPTLIDFPQIISAAHNSRAEFFFRRDLEALRTHLVTIDPELASSRGDAAEIWRAFVRRDLSPDFLPSGKPPPEPDVRSRHGGGQPPREGRPQGGQPGGGRGRQGQGGQPQRHAQGQRPPSRPQGHGEGRGQPSRQGPHGHDAGHGRPPRQGPHGHDAGHGQPSRQGTQGHDAGHGQPSRQGPHGHEAGHEHQSREGGQAARPQQSPQGLHGQRSQQGTNPQQGGRPRHGQPERRRGGQPGNHPGRRGGHGPEVSYVGKSGAPAPPPTTSRPGTATPERRESEDPPAPAPSPSDHPQRS